MKIQVVMTNAFTLGNIGYTVKGHTENDNTQLKLGICEMVSPKLSPPMLLLRDEIL